MDYQINTTDFITSLLPIDKRQNVFIGYLSALADPMQYLNDVFNEYIYGSSYSLYATASTYNNGDIVNGGIAYNNAVYQSITVSNINQLLSNQNYWYLRNTCFIGMQERSQYNILNLEYALNRWFQTTFRQPNGYTMSTTHSDIYLIDNVLTETTLFVGDNDFDSGYFNNTSDIDCFFDSSDGAFSSETIGFIVNVPTAVFTALPSGSYSIYQQIDKYNQTGIFYNINLY